MLVVTILGVLEKINYFSEPEKYQLINETGIRIEKYQMLYYKNKEA